MAVAERVQQEAGAAQQQGVNAAASPSRCVAVGGRYLGDGVGEENIL